jgi:hypothetical protein
MNRRGHTLLELAISTTILAVIGGGIFTLTRDSDAVLDASMSSVHASRLCEQGLRRLRDDLEVADLVTLAIDATPLAGDAVSLQLPIAVAGGVVTWGARAVVDGRWTDFPNATVQYVVQPPVGGGALRLVRRVVDGAGVALAADEVVADRIDEPGAGGKGVIVARNGRLVTLTVRVRLSHDDDRTDAGEDYVKSRQATVRLRNP